MKEAGCLATSLGAAAASQIVALYSRRFRTEESLRDIKDLRFWIGLSAMSMAEPERRDRLLLVCALAMALLALLGAAGERLGMERYLKANTAKSRTYSLFRQGCFDYQALPMMPEAWLRPLMKLFGQLVRGCLSPDAGRRRGRTWKHRHGAARRGGRTGRSGVPEADRGRGDFQATPKLMLFS